MSTIVLSMMEDSVCYVDIVTGGGKHGFMGFSFGAEKKHTALVSDALESVCSDLALRIAPS